MSDYKPPKIVTMSFSEFEDEYFQPPSRYYIRTALNVEFICCRDRAKANEYLKEVWNNKYVLRTIQKAVIR